MAQILPFSGWRFDLSQIGGLADVLVPSPNLLTPELRRNLYRLHPCNVIRLVDQQPEPGDADNTECLRRASGYFRLWRREGILQREHEDAFYALQLLTSQPNGPQERWSLLAVVRPELDESGTISPACLTTPNEYEIQQAYQQRLITEGDFIPVQAIAANTNPDSEESLADLLQQLVRQLTPVECWCEDGTRWKLWPLTSPTAIARIHAQISHCRLIVVNEARQLHAALRQQQQLTAAATAPGQRDLAGCTLISITDAADPGLPENPAVISVNKSGISTGPELRHRAQQIFGMVCRFVGNEPNASDDALELVPINDEQPCLAAGTPDGEWHLLAAPARCRSTAELLELLTNELAGTGPLPLENTSPENAIDYLRHPPNLVLAAPSPWSLDAPLHQQLRALLPGHCQQQPSVPIGLVLAAHTNVTGRTP